MDGPFCSISSYIPLSLQFNIPNSPALCQLSHANKRIANAHKNITLIYRTSIAKRCSELPQTIKLCVFIYSFHSMYKAFYACRNLLFYFGWQTAWFRQLTIAWFNNFNFNAHCWKRVETQKLRNRSNRKAFHAQAKIQITKFNNKIRLKTEPEVHFSYMGRINRVRIKFEFRIPITHMRFLPTECHACRDAMLVQYNAVVVCLSVTYRYCIQTVTCRGLVLLNRSAS